MGHKKKGNNENLIINFGKLIDAQTNAIARMDNERNTILPAFYRGVMLKQR